MKNKKLSTIRRAQKITQKELAKSINISERQYQKYEYGQGLPNVLTAIKIADALDVQDLRVLWKDSLPHCKGENHENQL